MKSGVDSAYREMSVCLKNVGDLHVTKIYII